MKKKSWANAGWMMAEKLTRMLVTLVVWSAVIRYLSPQDFGLFSFALSVIFVMAAIAEGGMEAVLVREFVNGKQAQAVILGSAFALRLRLVCCVFGVMALFIFFLPMEKMGRILILVMSLRLLAVPLMNLDSFFQARLVPRNTALAQMAGLMVTALLCYVGIALHQPLIYFAFVLVAEALMAWFVLYLFYYPMRQQVGFWQESPPLIKALWHQSLPMIISGLAISVYMRLDQWMIKYMMGNEALGYYSVAARFSESFYFIGMVIAGAFFPAMIAVKKQGIKEYEDYLRWLTAVMVYIALGASCLMVAFGIPMVHWLVTERYAPAMPVLAIHVWASVFVFIGLVRTRWAINEGLLHFSMWMTLLGALLNVVLNLFFIPLWGIAGAAFATVLAQCFVGVVSNAFIPQARRMLALQFEALNPLVLWQKRGLGLSY